LVAGGESLREVLSALGAELAGHGFRRRGHSFVRETPECWAVINIQRASYSSAYQQSITIDLGIASKRLLRFDGAAEDAPDEAACHWRARVGDLLDGRDRWWEISDLQSPNPVIAEICDLLSANAVPLLAFGSSDVGLLELGISRPTHTMHEYEVLRHRLFVAVAAGRSDLVEPTITRLRERSRTPAWKAKTEAFLDRLRQETPKWV
jgi:Domain of unknown function (DUF4304)